MMNKSFNVFGKKASSGSKKEAEEMRKKEDEQAAAVAFEEYVATFQETAASRASGKVWVKAGTYDAGRRQEDTKEKGKLYKPTSRFEKDEKPEKPSFTIINDDKPDRPGKKKTLDKKKSNLEIFKEELKIIQEEREERHRLKKMLGLQEIIKLPPKPGDELRACLSLELDDVKMGSIDDGDPNTTNIYLGNLPTKVTEQQLMEIFGKFGPLASVKVMWPRTDEEKSRNRLSGFVAYMSRRDGERALKHLAGKEILNADVKLGWGKAVPIPAFPIYIPPTMMELTMPPPPSGLPFNAQPDRKDKNKIPPIGTPYPTASDSKAKEEFDRVIYNSLIKVVVPTDRTLIAMIHRVIEFVAREGPMFEAMIMNREISNPQYRFLFENQGPAHVYYRWKLFSILQGESTQRWRTDDFRMFKGGSIWRPPTSNPFTQGMPDELIPEDERDIRIGTLSNAQRARLERMLRNITPSRNKISEIMIFTIEHSEAIQEICECIKESLSNPKTSLQKKIARLYVVSDVLYNCTVKGMNAIGYRKGFKVHLPSIFQEVHYAYQTACSEGIGSSADCFKERVMACCRAWDDWGIYPSEFLIRLQNIFLGLLSANSREEENKILELEGSDDDEEVLRKRRKSPPRAQLPPKSALNLVRSLQSSEVDEDIDGVPLDFPCPPLSLLGMMPSSHPLPRAPQEPKKKGGFVPSKWETVDPEEVKAGAVTTTSKWDLFEENNSNNKEEGLDTNSTLVGYTNEREEAEEEEEDIDGKPMDDEDLNSLSQYSNSQGHGRNVDEFENNEDLERRRLFLREVELKVLAYQDELETGRRQIKLGQTAPEMVEEYRRNLMNRDRHKKKRIESFDNEEVDKADEYDENGSEGGEHRERKSSRRNRDRERERESRSSNRRRRSRSSSSSRSSSKKPHRDESPYSSSTPSSKRHRDRERHRSRSAGRDMGGSDDDKRRRRSSRSRSRSPRRHKHSKHKR